MFIGSIDKPSRTIIENILDTVDKGKVTDVWVGCSGNFTFDRIASAKGFNVHSNDVALYSRVIAGIVQDNPFPFECVNSELVAIFSSWGNSKYTDLIKLMFAAKYGQFAARKNDYQKTMLQNYAENADRFLEGTLEKFEKNSYFDFEIAEFFYGDFKAHIANAAGPVFLYAPTYKGGYEKLYQFINDSFEYEHAEYDLFESKEAGPYYEQVLQEKEACIYSDILYPETAPFLHGTVTYSGSKKDVYLYSSVKSCKKNYFFADAAKLLEKTPKILNPDDELPEEPEITVLPVKVAVINHYKHLFMSARVDYSTGGDYALAFLMNGKIFGFASFSKTLGTANSKEILFLHSDFVVPNNNINRLSKLLLYILRAREVKKLISRYYFHSYKGLQTSVYSELPASMKYRGPFTKVKEKCEKGKLVYIAEFTNLSIKECFEKWQNRKPLK